MIIQHQTFNGAVVVTKTNSLVGVGDRHGLLHGDPADMGLVWLPELAVVAIAVGGPRAVIEVHQETSSGPEGAEGDFELLLLTFGRHAGPAGNLQINQLADHFQPDTWQRKIAELVHGHHRQIVNAFLCWWNKN